MPFFAAVLGLSLSACGNLPQPFSHDGQVSNPLIAPGERAGINIVPLAGTKHGDELAAALAEALRKKDLVAHSKPVKSPGFTIVGLAREGAAAPGDKVKLAILWRILDATGRPAGIVRQHHLVARDDWERGSAQLLHGLAAKSAEGLAQRFSVPRVKPADDGRLITIFDVDGAPGDGRIGLRRSLAFELRKLGFRVIETEIQGSNPIVLIGNVRIGPDKKGTQPVIITWSVLGGDGRVLGSVAQSNQIETGSLNRHWGVTAALVARAAAPGIKRLIEKAADNRPGK